MSNSSCSQPLRLGFFGGSFDPIHFGHLTIAQDALEQIPLDKVYFIPAAQSPLKGKIPLISDTERLEMIQLAIQEQPHFGVMDIELKRGGTSYTIDTLKGLKKHFPGADLFWLIGADQLELFPQWRNAEALLQIAQFICSTRPGYSPVVPDSIDSERIIFLKERSIPISSSKVREQLKSDQEAPLFLPPKVAKFINDNRLYF